jgi:hypothetical protein
MYIQENRGADEAEIIPFEPDPDNTGAGREILWSYPSSLPINRKPIKREKYP